MTPLHLLRTAIPAGLCAWGVLAGMPRFACANDKLQLGAAMPAFSLPRGDGKPGEFGLAQLKGRPAAVVFWRPNQKLSLDALHDAQAVAQEVGAGKLQIVAVDAARSTAEQLRSALAAEKLTCEVVLDPQRELYGKIGVIVCPTTLLLDSNGILRFTIASRPPQYAQIFRSRVRFLLGAIDERQMNKEIEPTILKVDHDVAAAWRMYNLGVKLQTEGKPDQALAVFEKAVSEHPSLPEARCALGFMKLAAGELDVAAQHFQAALTHDPAFPIAKLGQATVLARTGQPQQAEPILLSLLAVRPIAARVRYELGRIYRDRGELEKANTYFADALTVIFPESKVTAGGTPPPPSPATSAPRQVAQSSPLPRPPGTTAPAPVANAPSNPPAAQQPALSVHSIAFPSDGQFVGVKQCKKCHLQQWKSWQDTKMAHAFDVLQAGAGADVKSAHKLDPQKDYRTDAQCLGCHSNGYGIPGGYPRSPGDARAAQDNTCVGCESCHGPGSKFVAIHKDIQDKQRHYTQSELYQAGQFKVDATVCIRCHDAGNAPCIGPGYVFDFEKRKEQGTHKHYDLSFRDK